MSNTYRTNVVSTARAELDAARLALKAAQAAAFTIEGNWVEDPAAFDAVAQAASDLEDAVNQFKRAWAFATRKD